jgi:uncharacterized membrane protein YcfT
MFKQRMMWILWPSFLMAGVLEILVFAMVDPHDLRWFGLSLDIPRQAVYTIGFFVLWMGAAASSALTILLALSSTEINESVRD